MKGSASTGSTRNAAGGTVVGIDVGGKHKGYHAVAITGGAYAGRLATRDAQELAHWCRTTMRAQAIAIDAPCHWSTDGRCRPAERELMQQGIWCFSTPTREKAVAHPKNYFGWMLRGEKLYQALVGDYPLCRGLPIATRNCCFETFPHAIAWHLRGGQAKASQKRTQRRELLEQAGIDLTHVTNIDLIDAALCALTAYRAVTGGECVSYGEEDTGIIIVPRQSKS